RLESEMRRQEKLAAIGTLAAGVAHEIRNPLSSIKGYATYFKQKFPENSEDSEAADVMLNEANRLNRVISDLLSLSAQGSLKLKPIDLTAVANHVLRLLRQNAKSRKITIETKFAARIPLVMADMEKISQALLNICLNAFDAMGEGGTLTVAISGGKNRVCLLARDTGSGIPPEIMEKIFDPYFTTKGSGTGLGLPMTHKIVREHNGEIDATSRVGTAGTDGETIFKIWLPAAPRGDRQD
ncbi:MAG: two-component system sensor histidine kinase ZraS, partial [Desulfovibrio sp.]|nr:two-component system sensor histidine kinase ZraS [Desulfovibrio sp.]